MGVGNSLKSCYRSASRHPLLMFMVFALIWTYLCFPFLFSLLVQASPVIASTLILLGTLLFYGHANAPEIQKEGKPHHHEIHNLVFGGMGNTGFDDQTNYLVHNMNTMPQEAKGEFDSRKPVLVNRCAPFQPSGTGSVKSKGSDGSRRNSFEPSHSVLRHLDDDNKGWETGSDVVEGSSNASMVDHFPMLDEHLHEIVNETDDDVDDDHYDHEDIEVQDDDEDENVMTWTGDGPRSLMNLGTLELERNQRLESLIARQKAIKNMRMLAEKNIIDTHISTARNHPFELPSHSHENILGSAPYNIMPRRNSIDLPYDPHGGKPDLMGPTFQSDSASLQTNHPLGHRHRFSERLGSDTESIGSSHTPDINEHIIQRNRISVDGDIVKLHQAAERDNRSNEVKISGENTGYEDKISKKSSSSSFCDVTNDINDVDDDNEEEEFGSIENSPKQDSKDIQDSEDSGDTDSDSDSDTEEVGLTQRIKSWLTGW